MADTKAGASTDVPARAAGEPDDQGPPSHADGSRHADEHGRKPGRKAKGRKRGNGRDGDSTKASGKGRKQKQRKRQKPGQRRGPSLDVRPLAILSTFGGIAAGLVVGFISGRSSGRH